MVATAGVEISKEGEENIPGLVGVVDDAIDHRGLLEDMVAPLATEPFYRVDRYSKGAYAGARIHLGVFNSTPQPYVSEDICVFFDGKCYGYDNAAKHLKRRGYRIEAGCDASFCAAAYLDEGPDFVRDLNGPFICVIAEPEEGRVQIMNDRYGLLPLNYALSGGSLLYATHLEALLAYRGLSRRVDSSAILDFFAFGRLYGDRTFLESVSVLPSGAILDYSRGQCEITRYWDYPYAPDYTHDETWFVERLVQTWREAVSLRLEGSHQYGIALSGGLDSRSIVGGIPAIRRSEVSAISHGPSDCDDVRMAEAVAHAAGLPFERIDLPNSLILETPSEAVRMTDGVDYIGVNFLPKLSRQLREDGMDVIFHGIGPDTFLAGDVFGGYHSDLLKLPAEVRDDYLYRKWRFFSDDELNRLLLPEFRTRISSKPRVSFDAAIAGITDTDPLDRSAHFDLLTHHRRLAVMGLRLYRTALEVAVPAFDNAWVDVALQIPTEFRANYRIYRKFLARLAPDLAMIPYNRTMVRPKAPLLLWKAGSAYLYRKEQFKARINRLAGTVLFPPRRRGYVDFKNMLKTDPAWDRLLTDLLLGPRAKVTAIMDRSAIEGMLEAVRCGALSRPDKVLYLASLELFLQAHDLDLQETTN